MLIASLPQMGSRDEYGEQLALDFAVEYARESAPFGFGYEFDNTLEILSWELDDIEQPRKRIPLDESREARR